jgi:endonuclease YncB( thermonuclease family)
VIQPFGIQTNRTRGQTFYTRQPASAASPALAWRRDEILDVLLAAVSSGTAAAAALDRPSAGKTGTTQEYRDAWYVGFTADAVVGVWVGNDDNTPMRKVTGGDVPALIWRDFIREADRVKAVPPVSAGAIAESASDPSPSSDQVAEPSPTQPPSDAGPERLRGVPEVIDTGTLRLEKQTVRLLGVIGQQGRFAAQMEAYVAGREVTCEPADRNAYRCVVGGHDLSQAVLHNGGGRAEPNAPPYLLEAERQAQANRRGVWGGEAKENPS